MFHELDHGASQGLSLAKGGMLFKVGEQSSGEFGSGVTFNRPVRDE